MKNQDQLVCDEMRKLIRKSCNYQHLQDRSPYYGFQKSLLKFFFSAADVGINYDTQEILLWTSGSSQFSGQERFVLQEAVSVSVSYTTLEETLKGCLEQQPNAIRFYKSLLFHYNHVKAELINDALSA